MLKEASGRMEVNSPPPPLNGELCKKGKGLRMDLGISPSLSNNLA